MIITVVDQCGARGKAIGASLALLRARAGRKVVVIDADSVLPSGARDRGLPDELERLITHYHDIVIDTDGREASGRAALIAARLAIIPIQANQSDLDCHYPLIARLNVARMFNPGLRVMFVIAAGPAEPSDAELARIRGYVGQVMAATLCSTVIHEPGEIAALYHDVFPV